MNKKYLNVILFSALIMGTAGTFTSCKDYDDDIADLNGRVDAVEKGLEALKADFGSLGYVKDVTFANGKLTVTKNNGTPVSYDIPNTTDGNTTYTLDVAQKGNSATITLKGSDGSTISKDLNFTDTDTDKFDASQLTYDAATGVVSYKGVATGVKIVIPEPAKVSVVKYIENGVVLGWQIDGTKLLISDALPITSFEYIPEKILAGWGERVIVFEENSYVPKVITTDEKVAKVSPVVTNYMPNEAIPQYNVNPSSATLAQLAEEGKPVILKKTVEQVTRAVGTFIEWKKSEIKDGVMTVTLEADPSLFEDEQNKLDEIALQFTAKEAGNKITTEYVGVINKTAEIDLVLTDKEVTTEDAKDDNCHFAITKADAVAQAAAINASNMPETTNSHLVQNVTYSKAIAGIDLNELVHACNVKDADGHKFFNYAAHSNLTLSFEPVPYTLGQTPQEQYMKLEGTNKATFKAVNYGDVNESCIGKAPIVRAELRDSHNGNALVAAAYIKLLIVGDEAAPAEDDIVINNTETIGLGCNTPEHNWTTNDKFMSTQVYPFPSNNKLTALSKEQFHTIYKFAAAPVTGYTNKGTWTVTESIITTDGKINHEVKFVLNDQPLVTGQYYAYGIYQRTTVDADLNKVDNSRNYPMNVVIKYIVNVDAVNFTATSADRVSNAWNADKTAASIYCETPGTGNTTKIIGDLNELFDGGKVVFTYSNEFNAAKYPSFDEANMDYRFVFSAKNLKAARGVVTGVDGTKYQLALNAAKTELHAVSSTLVTITATDLTATNLVATLSGNNNKDVNYANTDVAKNLLNIAKRDAGSFYAIMDIVYFNGCNQNVEVTNGEFNLLFIRPVNVSSDSSKHFTDGLNAGDPANTLNLADLVIFNDWRYESPLNSFAAHLNYYKYYGVTKIDCPDLMKVKTNWGGKGKRTLEAAFGTEQAQNILSIDPKVATPDGTTLPDYGTISYIKTSKAEISSYELYIPLTITYTWGTIVEEITVTVQATK